MVDGINRIFAGWYGFPRPVVAAVNGHAIAGGLILALCADYRVGVDRGQYGVTELKAGLPYPAVAMAVVRAELHAPAARRLVLGADLVDAKEALDAGAFDELAEPDQVLHRATEVARGPVAPAVGGVREGQAAAARARPRGGARAARPAARGLERAARRPDAASKHPARR